MKIDQVDLNILRILEEDGRSTNNTVAKKLSLSEGTVRNRIKKMTDNHLLQMKGLSNPSIRTDKQLIYVLAKTSLHKDWDATAKRITRVPGVKSVSLIASRFDVLIEAYIEPHRIFHFLHEGLSDIETIVSTETLIVVRSYNKWV